MPLCGVAEARISASVFGARTLASWLFSVPELVTLWDSSMTTASQVCLPQVGQVLVALERVDRDDDALEVAERVAGGGQLLPDPLDPERVQPDERDREPRPHLALHLLEDVPGRDDQDPLAAPAPDQLGQDHADLQRLAEPDRVGEQDARAQVRLVQRLADGGLLVAERVGEHVDADCEGGAVERDRGLAQRRLEPQPGPPVVRRVVGHHGRLGGVEHAQVASRPS